MSLQCHVNGAIVKDGKCYLGEVPIISSPQEFSARIKKASVEGKKTLLYSTAKWCPSCRLLGPFVKPLLRYAPPDTEAVIYDLTDEKWLPFQTGIPSLILLEPDGKTHEQINRPTFFNYYGAGQQVGLKCFFNDQAAEVGLVWNIQNPLMRYGVGLQLNTGVFISDESFQEANIGVNVYSPTIGDLLDFSPVRFLGLLVGIRGAINKKEEVSFQMPLGIEVVRANLHGWLLSLEVLIGKLKYPTSEGNIGFVLDPQGGIILGHSF